MPTTIQVSETTKQLLEKYKEEENAASYDEVILHTLSQKKKIPHSMFGADKGMRWKKEDRMKFREL